MIFVYSPDDLLQCVLANDGSSKCPFWDDEVTEKLNGQLNFDFTIPSSHPDSKYLQAGAYIVIKDIDGKTYKLFQIIQVEGTYGQESQELRVTCEGAYYELGEHIIEKLGFTQQDVGTVLRAVLGNSNWSVDYVDSELLSKKYDIAFTMQDGLACIQQILDKWKCEAKYSVTVEMGKIARRHVSLYSARGDYRGVKFTFDKNLSSVERTVDFADVKTRFYGVGKQLFTNKDGTYEWADFQDMVWSTEKGDPVDKPKGQTWVENPEAVKRWGIRNGVYQEDTEDIKKLLENTWKELKKHANPKISYALEAVDLHQQKGYEHMYVELGDTIVVTDLDLNINFGARVQEIKWSLTDPMNFKLTVGDFLELLTDKFAKIYQKYDDVMNSITKTRLDLSDAVLTIHKTASSIRAEINSESANIHNYIDYNIHHLESVFNDKNNEMSSRIEQTKSSITHEVSAVRDKVVEVDGKLTHMKQDLHSEIHQTAEEITHKVQRVEGDLDGKADLSTVQSIMSQTADTIELKVERQLSSKADASDLDGKADISHIVSYINMSPEKIDMSSINMNLEGFVTISQMRNNGLTFNGITTIDGGVITGSEFHGGNVDTQNLSAHGSVFFYQSANISQDLLVGHHIGSLGTIACKGDLNVAGKKNCAIPTEHYGTVLMNAFEFPEVMMGDIGFGETNDQGIACISIDPKLAEVINTDIAYHVLVTMSSGVTEEIKTYPSQFTIKAKPTTKFTWVIIGKRRGYENEGFVSKEQEIIPSVTPTATFKLGGTGTLTNSLLEV